MQLYYKNTNDEDEFILMPSIATMKTLDKYIEASEVFVFEASIDHINWILAEYKSCEKIESVLPSEVDDYVWAIVLDF
jgi:hypothetical protein